MSVAPHAGIIDFGTFTPPTDSRDGIQGEVPKPLIGQQNYVLTASGWAVAPTPVVDAYPPAGIPTSTGSAWGTSYGVTGTGDVVLSTAPTITGGAIINATTQDINIGGSQTSGNLNLGTGGRSGTINIGTSAGSGGVVVGGDTGTGSITFGRSSLTQTVNIATGATQSTRTKTLNIGTLGASGSTTNIAIGSTTGTSTTTLNGAVNTTGDITVRSGSTTGSATITTPTTELVLSQTGDSLGASVLRLQNRDGVNGAMFDASASAYALVDFVFKTSVGQRNIRYETRSGVNQFQIGLANTPTLIIADTLVKVNPTTASTSTTTGALQVAGGAGIVGALYVGADSFVNGLRVGLGAGAIATNTAVGFETLNAANTGVGFNTAIGYQTLKANTSGTRNTAIGGGALQSNTTGVNNTAIGTGALSSITTGAENTAIGQSAMGYATGGGNNVVIGHSSGFNVRNNRNTVVGSRSDVASVNDVNAIVLGGDVLGLGSNTTVIGNGSTTLAKIFGALRVGEDLTATSTTNIATGATVSGATKTINVGTGGVAGSTTNIAIGSTTGTSTTTVNGLLKQQTYTVATLPTGSAGTRSFVTDASSPVFGAAVVGGGAVGVPVYHDGTSWKVG